MYICQFNSFSVIGKITLTNRIEINSGYFELVLASESGHKKLFYE